MFWKSLQGSLEDFRKVFGKPSEKFWECSPEKFPGLEEVLRTSGKKWGSF